MRGTDLYEKTEKLSSETLALVRMLKIFNWEKSIINQLVCSSTIIGANYCEADCAESKKDFEHKIGICRKEAKETGYWLRILGPNHQEKLTEISRLEKESEELFLIFSKIVSKSRSNKSES